MLKHFSSTRYHVESRMFLVATLAVIPVFFVYTTEHSKVYSLKRESTYHKSSHTKLIGPLKKHYASGKPIGRHG